MEYDRAGNLTSQKDERGNVYSYAYDKFNRKESMTYPPDDTGDRKHEDYLYDWAGNLFTYTNRTRAVQTFTYDERNRQTRFTWTDGTSWQNTVYDAASRVRQITNAVSTINYTYYDDNRLQTEEESIASSVFGGSPPRPVTYTYYDDGSRKTIQYPGGDSFTYAYTNRNQLFSITATSQSSPIVTYTYDLSGNITDTARNNGTHNGTHTGQIPDDVNRVKAITHNLVGTAPKSFAYTYNRVNNITTVQRDGGQGDGYEYDYSRQITGFKQNGTVNAAAGIVTSPASSTGFEFDGCGNRMSMSNSNTSLPSYTYAINDLNQYTAMTAPGAPTPTPPPGQTPTPPPATPTPAPSTPTPPPATPTPPPATATPPPATPTPSPAQQVAEVQFSESGHYPNTVYVTLTSDTPGAKIFFALGATGYLVPTHNGASPTGNTLAYTGPVGVSRDATRYLAAVAYKAGMNDSAITQYAVDNSGGAANPDSPISGASPTYDANGNLKTYDGWTYTYDAQNRLMTASGNGHSAAFYYDGKNRQIARVIDNQVRFSVWDDWELIEEYASPSSRSAAYLQGAHGVIRSLVNGAYFYYYQDSLGSTTHLADSTGQLLESYRYDLYGKPSYFNATAQPLNSSTYNVVDLHAGERWVGEIGLYDLRNRFMSPELGRFIQADPIGFKGDASNLYRYCHNDPADSSDPTGLIDNSAWSRQMLWQGGGDGTVSEQMNVLLNPGRPQAGMDGGGGAVQGGPKSDSAEVSFTAGMGTKSRAWFKAKGLDENGATDVWDPNGIQTFGSETPTGIHVEQKVRAISVFPDGTKLPSSPVDPKSIDPHSIVGVEMKRVERFRAASTTADLAAKNLARQGFKDVQSAVRSVDQSTRAIIQAEKRQMKLDFDLFHGWEKE